MENFFREKNFRLIIKQLNNKKETIKIKNFIKIKMLKVVCEAKLDKKIAFTLIN